MKIQLGKLGLQFHKSSIPIPENFKRFEQPESLPCEKEIEFRALSKNDTFERRRVFQNKDLIVLSEKQRETRILLLGDEKEPYAIYHELDEKKSIVYTTPAFETLSHIDTIFLSALALERHMLEKQAVILHCAYLEYDKKAILFSGPSGIGKTTHTTFWEKSKKGVVLNGDRALVEVQKEGCQAYGWPMCGSSEICHNESNPVGAVVMLRKGEANQVRTLSMREAHRLLLEQVTVNYWNREATIQVLDLLQELLLQIPVIEFTCRKEAEAVAVLEHYLQEELHWND